VPKAAFIVGALITCWSGLHGIAALEFGLVLCIFLGHPSLIGSSDLRIGFGSMVPSSGACGRRARLLTPLMEMRRLTRKLLGLPHYNSRQALICADSLPNPR